MRDSGVQVLDEVAYQLGFGALANVGPAECVMRDSDWVVYCKDPFGGPQEVLRYLARYQLHLAEPSKAQYLALFTNRRPTTG